MTSDRKSSRLVLSAFGWGSGIAAVRMVCSFLSIKVTAVYLGPAGLALVAQYSNFIGLFQSMLGQGLVTGTVRLSAEAGTDAAQRRRIQSTALRMGLGLSLVLIAALVLVAPVVSGWLLTDRAYAWLIAVAGLAVAASMLSDLLQGTLSVGKEIGLVGRATMVSTVLALFIFAPCSYWWGITGGLWALFGILILTACVNLVAVHFRSKSLRLSDFGGRFDREVFRRLLSFYPMLIANGVLPPLVLILVRDTVTSELSLDEAGLWQATWRLSEAYQAAITSSITLYFMQSLGARVNDREALRSQILRTLGVATASTAAMALVIFLLREPIVHLVLSARFVRVADLMPLQLLGDVLKMGGWILSMSLVALVRTRWFILSLMATALVFVLLAKLLVPRLGLEGVVWAYLCTGVLQCVLGALGLRDLMMPRGAPLGAAKAGRP